MFGRTDSARGHVAAFANSVAFVDARPTWPTLIRTYSAPEAVLESESVHRASVREEERAPLKLRSVCSGCTGYARS